MSKYQLRKINVNSHAVIYDTCAEFDNFAALRDAINSDNSLFRGRGFHVLDNDNNIIFDDKAVQHLGNVFTLSQAIDSYN